MKKVILSFAALFFSFQAFSQVTVSFHQSNLPFIGVNRQFGDRWMPEARIGVDNYIENLSVELIATYLIKNEEDRQIYVGAGARLNLFGGIVVPVGINYYPFSKKEFGFHLEASPLLLIDEGVLFRSSFGVRYRFLKR